jgi:uncharacterized membrane protein
MLTKMGNSRTPSNVIVTFHLLAAVAVVTGFGKIILIIILIIIIIITRYRLYAGYLQLQT